jgi:Bifunctional DNA primase/polymerase, N-terminal/Primase C terminal 2 (PriCT-2)/Protein of unknown function (DUF3987)
MSDTLTSNHAVALALARQGFNVFPCHSGGPDVKKPKPGIFWRSVSTSNERTINSWWQKWPDAVPGLALEKSGLIAIDADAHDGKANGVEAFSALMDANGYHPDTAPLVLTPNQGNHHFFKQPSKALGNGRGLLPAGIDVRGQGGYVIAPGATLDDGRSYELFGDLGQCPPLPDWLYVILTASKETPKLPLQITQNYENAETDEISEMLSFIHPDCAYDDWVSALMAVHSATGGAGFAIANAWSARGTKYKGVKEIEAKWRSFKGSGVTLGTLATLARQSGADLSAIAIKYRGQNFDYDAVEAAEAAQLLIQNTDGTLHDAQTGEIVEMQAPKAVALTFPAGLVGEIAQWIVDTARLPQPDLALGAAMAIVGTAAGRQFAGPTMAGTALYILGLAETGSGKDHPLKCITRIFNAAGLSHHIGPPEFISMTAMVKVITRKALTICPMDEFGDFMRRVYAKRGSPHERAVPKVLRTLWSANFGPVSTPEWANVESVTTNAPHMSIFGVSTEDQFYSSLEGGAASDGTLNRFLIIGSKGDPSDQEPIRDPHAVPKEIIDRLRNIYFASGELIAATRNDPYANPADNGQVKMLVWCPDGSEKLWRDFAAEIKQRSKDDPEKREFNVRALEMSIRIATIIAIGRGQDSVRIEDIRSGIAMASESVNIMVEGAGDYMAENDNQANAQRIRRAVKKHGGMIKQRDLIRSLQNVMRSRDLKETLDMMVQGGELEKFEVKNPNNVPVISFKISQQS